MFCPKCGAQIPDNARFCGECGATVTPVAPAGAAAGATPGVASGAAGAQVPPQAQGAATGAQVPPAAGYGATGAAGVPGAGAYGATQGAPGAYAAPGRFAGAAAYHHHAGVGAGTPMVAGISLWSLVCLVAVVVAGICLFQSWIEVPVADIYAKMAVAGGSSSTALPQGVPATVSLGLIGLAQIQSVASPVLGVLVSSVPAAVTSGLQSSGTLFAALTLLWAAAIALVSINAYVVLTTKAYDERLAIAGGVVLVVLALVGIIGAGTINGQVADGFKATVSGYAGSAYATAFLNFVNTTTFVRATAFAWITLVGGLATLAVPLLRRFGIIR